MLRTLFATKESVVVIAQMMYDGRLWQHSTHKTVDFVYASTFGIPCVYVFICNCTPLNIKCVRCEPSIYVPIRGALLAGQHLRLINAAKRGHFTPRVESLHIVLGIALIDVKVWMCPAGSGVRRLSRVPLTQCRVRA